MGPLLLSLYLIGRVLQEKAPAKYFYLDEDKNNLLMSKFRCCDEAHLSYPCCHLIKQAAQERWLQLALIQPPPSSTMYQRITFVGGKRRQMLGLNQPI